MRESILIVEDKLEIYHSLEHILSQRGLNSYRASSVNDALELMKRMRFRMAFLDTSLPDMNHTDLVRKLKNTAPRMNIVLISDATPQEHEKSYFEMDECLFSACIYKPVLNKAVLDAVDTCW